MKALYNKIGADYDTTRKADPFITERISSYLLSKTTGPYLDVACGTGNYTSALKTVSGQWYGTDKSDLMLKEARKKSSEIIWSQNDIENLAFDDGYFSGAMCTLAIHHFPNLLSAFKEVNRVLSSGNFVIFTTTPEQMAGYWLNEYFPDAMRKSIDQMPSLEQMEEAFIKSGFTLNSTEPYFIKSDLKDFFLYSGKFNPSIYLSKEVRNGISTFASLANEKEIDSGCQALSEDIESGKIEEVINFYKNKLGDYIFVTASKK